MTQPDVSVIMSVYNGEKYVREAIDSILSQTFTNYEFIIIDDGSTDKTRDILAGYDDSRIRLKRNSKNLGLTVSLNRALSMAGGRLIARMDADDISMPERLYQQVMFLESNPAVGIVGINSQVIDDMGNILTQFRRPLVHSEIMAALFLENQFVHGSIMLRKNLIEKHGAYDADRPLAQDYDLILRFSTFTCLANLPDPLYKWRRNNTSGISLTKRPAQIAARDDIRKAFLDRHYNLSKTFQDLLMSNFRGKITEPVLSGVLEKLIADLAFPSNLALKIKMYLSILKIKASAHIRSYFPNQLARLKQLKRKFFPPHPYNLIFLLKNTCNANCIMCGLRYGNNRAVSEISLEDYRKMLRHLKMNKVRQITFSGGGEPLLCRDFMNIISYTRRNYHHAEMHLFTNGISLTENFARELIRHRFQKIVISLNAATEETYVKVMRKNAFNKVISNIKKLVSIRNREGADTLVQISFVASLWNIDDLPPLISLGAELGVDMISMQYCRFYSSKLSLDSNDADISMDPELSLFFHQNYSDRILKDAALLAVRNNISFSHEPLFGSSDETRGRCSYPWTTILIGPEGEVFPCGGGEVVFYSQVKDRIYDFGNLLNEQISGFWNNKDYRKLRRSCEMSSPECDIPRCHNCNHTLLLKGSTCQDGHFIHI